MKFFKKYSPWLRNRYVIVLLFTLIWMLFFDQHDIISQFQARMRLRALKKDREYYLDKIQEVKRIRDELMTNPKTLEKFARERYYMKKDNEDIFIIEKKD